MNFKLQFVLFYITYLLFRNVIDVAALDSHNLQQHEYLERMKQYSLKLQQACATNKLPSRTKSSLLQDIAAPEKILGSEAILVDDLNLVSIVKLIIHTYIGKGI